VVQGNQGNFGRVEGSIVDGVRRKIHVRKVSRCLCSRNLVNWMSSLNRRLDVPVD
jgi:hypothetical protein